MSKFNFAKTEAAKENNFLKPGIYNARISDVTLGKYPSKGTPYLEIIFETEDGYTLSEKLTYGSDKAAEVLASRIQYLYEAWLGKKLDKELDDEGLATYLKKVFTHKQAGSRKIIFGGEYAEKDGKLYARLPYAGFIAEEDAEIGEFAEDSANFKKYVTKATRSAVSSKSNGLLNDADEEGDDDLPFGKAVEAAKVDKKTNGLAKKPSKKEVVKEEDNDDLPWPA